MAAKTRYPKEVDSYLKALPPERRPRVKDLIELTSGLYPASILSMKYKMPSFETPGGWFAIGNQKHYVSVYTCSPEHIAHYLDKHPKTPHGKGCLNFKDTDTIDMPRLKKVIRNALKQHKNNV